MKQQPSASKPVRRNFAPKGKTVYIGNLNYLVREKELYELFGKFGKVKHVNLITKPGNEAHSKGIAFVYMLKSAHADNAIKHLDGREIGGRMAKVSEAAESHQTVAFKRVYTGDSSKRHTARTASPDGKLRGHNVEEIVEQKRQRRRKTGLSELFANTGKNK